MKVLALGVDHRSAPAAIREALAFDGPKLAGGLDALTGGFPGCEFVVLSTCNRVEVYAAGNEGDVPTPEALETALAEFHRLSLERFRGHLMWYHDQGAVGHLFRVAASLESLVLGEGQILGQVRDAYQAANARNTVRTILHAVFQEALRIGKKVREETGMAQGKLSIASVAVERAREVFDTFHDKTVLVIGAGKMADLTLQHLKALGPGRILVTNRNLERAQDAAARWGGTAIPFDRLNQGLTDADLVVSTTAATEAIVGYEQYARVQRARRNRLVLILDIAIPRDFDPRIGDLPQVMLFHVDDLRTVAEQNLKERQRGIDPANAIIDDAVNACYGALRHQRYAGTVLRQLGDHADTIRGRELDALFTAFPNFTAAERDAITRTTSRILNQILHQPRATLRSAASEVNHEHPHPLLNAVRHLFGLPDVT